LYDIFAVRNGLKQGVASLSLFFSFVAIRWVQINQDGLKLNGSHQLLVYAHVNMLGEIHFTKKNTEALVGAEEAKPHPGL
jgi:hypothetical protein